MHCSLKALLFTNYSILFKTKVCDRIMSTDPPISTSLMLSPLCYSSLTNSLNEPISHNIK